MSGTPIQRMISRIINSAIGGQPKKLRNGLTVNAKYRPSGVYNTDIQRSQLEAIKRTARDKFSPTSKLGF